MAYDPGAIDSALAAAVGDDPLLIADLRQAFVDGAMAGAKAMAQAGSVVEWRAAARRLAGLAASFGAVRLMALATAAADDPPGSLAALRAIERAIDRI